MAKIVEPLDDIKVVSIDCGYAATFYRALRYSDKTTEAKEQESNKKLLALPVYPKEEAKESEEDDADEEKSGEEESSEEEEKKAEDGEDGGKCAACSKTTEGKCGVCFFFFHVSPFFVWKARGHLILVSFFF